MSNHETGQLNLPPPAKGATGSHGTFTMTAARVTVNGASDGDSDLAQCGASSST
ncbi:MAG: hypothetical protein P4N59_33480 [Negativicutes bacterium]|nr:hypothetical protein [Negativicutes bacterium]